MELRIALITLVVRDYAEAISFYVDKLGFELTEDRALQNEKRWVVVAPPGGAGTGLLLAKAESDRQRGAIGAQAGGRVSFFLTTLDFQRDHAAFVAKGVHFTEEPRKEPYGTVAVFEDLYGNRWDLLQPG